MKRLACRMGGSSSTAKKAAELLFVVVALLALSVPVFSQGAVGTILGGVFDSSGGAIAGATVTVTDVARGTTRVLTTDASGQWTAPSLLVGTYSVRAEAKGFQTVEQTNVLLEVAESARVDLKLSPGSTTQTVTVTEASPAINSTDSTLGGTITNTAVSSLPLEGRNFLQLLQLRPGVVDTPGGNGTATVTNGRREGADVLLIEGVTQFDLGTSNVLINGAQKGGAVDELPLDSIQEFSTQQNPQAEYGWRDGSSVNLAVKSGTNSIHGSAYAFGRDASATDAKSFTALKQAEVLSNLTVEQPGFTVGGPILKDKLFWFVSGEFIRQTSTVTQGVPTAEYVTTVGSTSGTGSGCASPQYKTTTPGNCAFSLVDACKDLLAQGTTINPLSAQISGLNPATCVVSPASSTVENLWPSNPTTNSTLLLPNLANTSPSNNGLAKVDYSPSEKHHLDGFFYISRETETSASGYQPYWSSLGVGSTEEFAGAWTWTPNSNWVNDLRGGAAPNSGNSIAADTGINPASPYSLASPYTSGGYGINTGASGFGMMCMSVGGIFSSTMSGLGDCGKNGIRGPQYQLDFTDKVSYLHGNHAFKFGYEQVFVTFDDSSTANQDGLATFANLESFLGNEGPACLTCGPSNQGKIITGNNTDQWREQWHAAFAQDTWRISRRVTLTPGIRYEYIGAPHSIINKMGTFDPNQPGGAIQVGPGLPNSSCQVSGATLVSGTQNVACASTVTHPSADNFNPRVGVAWDVFGNGKTVLRGGIGDLSSFPSINSVAGNTVPYGDTLCNSGTNATGLPAGALGCPAGSIIINRYGTSNNAIAATSYSGLTALWNCGSIVPLPASCTTGADSVFPSSALASSTSGGTCGTSLSSKTAPLVQCAMLVSNPNLQNPKSIQWNLDLQRAITNNLTLDVAYIGTHGYDEIHTIDLNEPALGMGWYGPASPGKTQPLLNPTCIGATGTQTIGPGGGPSGAFFSASCTADATAEQAARPYAAAYPYFNYIAQTTNGFHSNYNGLQLTLDARNYHGLSFLAAYTFSHSLDDWTKSSQATEGLANPANPQYQYGNSDMDVRNRFRFSPTYMIPGIKTPGQMLEGWQISAIWAIQDGFAWAPLDETKNDWGGNGENADSGIPSPNSGVVQTWNYSGPKSAFSNNGDTPIPCYGNLNGCIPWATINMTNPSIWQTCSAAATAPYGNSTVNVAGTIVPLKELALAALTSSLGGCYMQNGGVLTPPAYGTLGDASRGLFKGPTYQNVDLVVQKNWKFRERYSAQFRVECYNVFNHVSYSQFSDGSSDPTGGSGVIGGGTFGYATSAQAPGNRQFQFGLKFLF